MKPSQRQLNKRCLCGSGKAFKNCYGKDLVAPKRVRIMPNEISVPRYPDEEDDFFRAVLTLILVSPRSIIPM